MGKYNTINIITYMLRLHVIRYTIAMKGCLTSVQILLVQVNLIKLLDFEFNVQLHATYKI